MKFTIIVLLDTTIALPTHTNTTPCPYLNFDKFTSPTLAFPTEACFMYPKLLTAWYSRECLTTHTSSKKEEKVNSSKKEEKVNNRPS